MSISLHSSEVASFDLAGDGTGRDDRGRNKTRRRGRGEQANKIWDVKSNRCTQRRETIHVGSETHLHRQADGCPVPDMKRRMGPKEWGEKKHSAFAEGELQNPIVSMEWLLLKGDLVSST